MTKHTYNPALYRFRAIITNVLNSQLELLKTDSDVFSRDRDQSSAHLKRIYSNLDEFMVSYRLFLANEIKPRFGENIVYQRVPTFRIHYPGNVAVGEFHRDSDYGHNSCELNFFVPLTDATDTATIWCETQPNKGDYVPLNCKYGDIIMFDGNHLRHGNRPNMEGSSRVSFDFRVIPYSMYEPEGGKSINTGKAFEIGDYYEVM